MRWQRSLRDGCCSWRRSLRDEGRWVWRRSLRDGGVPQLAEEPA